MERDKTQWKPTKRTLPEHLDEDCEGLDIDEQRKSLNWIYGLRDDGKTSRFTKTPDALNSILPFDLAYFLGILMDWDRRKSKRANSGWFYLPTKWIELRFPRATTMVQRRLFRQLREQKFLSFEMRYGRKRTRRWLTIDYRAIKESCMEAMKRSSDEI